MQIPQRKDDHHRLMEQIAQGDTDAFHTLYKALSSHVVRFLAANNGHGGVDDLVQETFVRLWQVRSNFRSESTALTFILGIAGNVAREHAATNSQQTEQSELPHIIFDRAEREIMANFKVHDCEDLTEWIQKLLETLPPKQREAVDLIYFQKLTISQATKLTECSHDIFYNRLYRAKKTLREKINVMKANGANIPAEWRNKTKIIAS